MKALSRSLVCAAVLLSGSSFCLAALSPTCQARYDAVAAKIASTQATGNSEQQASLQDSLAKESLCTDAKLVAAHDKAVKSQTATVAKREADLAKAQASGKESKIKKQQDRLAAAQDKLAKLKAEDPLAVK